MYRVTLNAENSQNAAQNAHVFSTYGSENYKLWLHSCSFSIWKLAKYYGKYFKLGFREISPAPTSWFCKLWSFSCSVAVGAIRFCLHTFSQMCLVVVLIVLCLHTVKSFSIFAYLHPRLFQRIIVHCDGVAQLSWCQIFPSWSGPASP